MLVYRIRNIKTGKFFASASHRRRSSWTATGTFFRKIDTIKDHLENLCHDWKLERNNYRFTWIEGAAHPERMKDYEVVVNNFTIHGERAIPAKKFMKGKK